MEAFAGVCGSKGYFITRIYDKVWIVALFAPTLEVMLHNRL